MTAPGKFVVVVTLERDEAMKLDDLVALERQAPGGEKMTRQSYLRAALVEDWGSLDWGGAVPGAFARKHGVVPKGGR